MLNKSLKTFFNSTYGALNYSEENVQITYPFLDEDTITLRGRSQVNILPENDIMHSDGTSALKPYFSRCQCSHWCSIDMAPHCYYESCFYLQIHTSQWVTFDCISRSNHCEGKSLSQLNVNSVLTKHKHFKIYIWCKNSKINFLCNLARCLYTAFTYTWK